MRRLILLGLVIVVLVSGCVDTEDSGPAKYEMNFMVEETEAPVNGNVYLYTEYLGQTVNGRLEVDLDRLYPGEITLTVTSGEEEYDFFFDMEREDLTNYSGMDFFISEEDLAFLAFDVGEFDAGKIEQEIFRLANIKRDLEGSNALKLNTRVAGIARQYSRQMAYSGFHHTSEEGEDVTDRLKAQDIFYLVAGENLFLVSDIQPDMDENAIAKMAIDEWMESPAHRSSLVDRDGMFSDTGIGAYCEEAECYVTMVFVALESASEITLQEDYCTMFWLYDPTYPFDFDVPVRISMSATNPVRTYIVADEREFGACTQGRSINAVKEYSAVDEIDETITAKKGYGLLFKSLKETDIAVLFDYH